MCISCTASGLFSAVTMFGQHSFRISAGCSTHNNTQKKTLCQDYLCQEPVDKDCLQLAKAIHPEYTLDIKWRIPRGIKDNDSVGRYQVDPKGASSCGNEEQTTSGMVWKAEKTYKNDDWFASLQTFKTNHHLVLFGSLNSSAHFFLVVALVEPSRR